MGYAKYTMTLDELINEQGVELFDFTYSLPDFVDKNFLEELFVRKYFFREIGSETINRWKIQLENHWKQLCYTYSDLFEIFEKKYLENDVLTNRDLEITRKNIFNDTPQSKLVSTTDYATNISEESISYKGSGSNYTGTYKYALLADYAEKLRHIYEEFINECEPLFMQLF